MEAFKFDEKMYVVGDAYLLHKFTHSDSFETSREEKLYGILTTYTPNKLTFMTINGPITYEATINPDLEDWNPSGRIDVLGNRYSITMMGLKANLSVIEQTFKPGLAYYIKTPVDWINRPNFYGIYAGYNEKDLWEWPEIKFMSEKGEICIHFVDILRGKVIVSKFDKPSETITFDDMGGK